MKVRLKHNHQVEHEIFPSARQQRDSYSPEVGWPEGWFVKGDIDGKWIFYDASEWEPVPEERWEDVTGACDWDGCSAFVHRNGSRFGDEVVAASKGYRFRKRAEPYGITTRPVFIIERKVSP